nr:unnamed protein product [Callosobruchus analis]
MSRYSSSFEKLFALFGFFMLTRVYAWVYLEKTPLQITANVRTGRTAGTDNSTISFLDSPSHKHKTSVVGVSCTKHQHETPNEGYKKKKKFKCVPPTTKNKIQLAVS